MCPLASLIMNESSIIALIKQDLRGIIAIGDTFSCFGGLTLMPLHNTTDAWPCRTLDSILDAICSVAAGTSAEIWGPCSISASIFSRFHGFLVLVGHIPTVYFRSSSAARWCITSPLGHIFLIIAVFGAWFGVGIYNWPSMATPVIRRHLCILLCFDFPLIFQLVLLLWGTSYRLTRIEAQSCQPSKLFISSHCF